MIRRPLFAAALAVSLTASLTGASAAVAEDAFFPAERFRPSMNRDGLLDVEWGGVGEHLQWDVALWGSYALNPLVIYDGDDRIGSLVEHRVGGNLTGSLALLEWVELGADLPLIFFQSRDDSALPAGIDPVALSAVGVGDLRVMPKIRLLRSAEQFVDLAIIPAFTLPTSLPGGAAYAGENQLTAVPELALSRGIVMPGFGELRAAINLGYRLRPEDHEVLGVIIGDELLYRAGLGYRFHELGLPLELDVTAAGATYAFEPFRSAEESPLEVKGGVKYDVVAFPAKQGAGDSLVVQAFAGAGTSIVNGFGTPDLRVLGGLRLGPPKDIDRDDDGIADKDDTCPEQAEDKDGFSDNDGCKDADNDRDGLDDDGDTCPNEAEDSDGHEDADGCPDPDNDADGVVDAGDRCRDVAGPGDNAGCPWPDSDSDGILDKDDSCKDVKGVAAQKGCPDGDNDGVTDAADLCPTLAGPAMPYGGCPDTDGDGFIDSDDKCPTEPETVNNVDDEDGCPDQGKVLVTLTKEKIVILDKVFFDTGKATIKPISFGLLNQVATVVRRHREIHKVRVEGHTDSDGADDKNLVLSQERAESVRAYLVTRGIDAGRVEAVGYGETRPVGDNATSDGKEQNRRVDFVILDDASLAPTKSTTETPMPIEPQPTTPSPTPSLPNTPTTPTLPNTPTAPTTPETEQTR